MAHHHHDHAHAHGHGHRDLLPWAFAATLGFAGVEALAGLWAGSLALLGDAGHMLTDSLALGLAMAASRLARRPPSNRHSFGLERVETLAALTNAGFMLAVVIGIAWSAVERLFHPAMVRGEAVIAVASAGLVLNVVVAWLLLRGERNLNTRGALLHVVADLFGSLAALVAGIVIQTSGWMAIDPLLSLLICLLILGSTVRLARDAIHMLLEGVPHELSLPTVGRRLAGMDSVASVHDLHIWALSSRRPILTAHIVVKELDQWERLLPEIMQMLRDEFDIDHATLQPEAYTPSLYAIAEPELSPPRA